MSDDEPKKLIALSSKQREPEPDVIEAIETLLQLAKRGEIRGIGYAYTGIREDGTPANRFGDVVSTVGGAIRLAYLLFELEGDIRRRIRTNFFVETTGEAEGEDDTED